MQLCLLNISSTSVFSFVPKIYSRAPSKSRFLSANLSNNVLLLMPARAAISDVVSFVTVSYTHLDVYKRQIQGRNKEQCKQSCVGQTAYSYNSHTPCHIRTHVNTYGDVYKRQVFASALSSSLIFFVAVIPSIFGIIISIKITS